MRKQTESGYRDKVFRLVQRIPRGRVMTYGQIAELLGDGYTPRTVGFVMHGSGDSVPWHRVVNARGACSTGGIVLPHDKQQRMLEAEGIQFDVQGRCKLETYLWIPKVKSRSRPKTSEPSLFKNNKSSARRR